MLRAWLKMRKVCQTQVKTLFNLKTDVECFSFSLEASC